MKYRIRLDELPSGMAKEQLCELLAENSQMVMVRHELPHGNPHYHVYVHIDVKENTLRQRFKRKFPDLPSTSYSLKKCDDDRVNEYVQYMFNTKHGNRWELVHVYAFDDTLLDDLKNAAQQISTDFAAAHSNKKSKGPTIWDIAQEVEIEFNKKFQVSVNDLGTQKINEYNLYYKQEALRYDLYTDIAISVLRRNKKAFDEYMLRKVISTAMSSTEQGQKVLRRKMLKCFIDE